MENNSDFVTVVVPVYNVEKYLNQCVNSILKQTYKNFELILVDDASTDSSGRICDDIAQQDPRVKVIHKENAGAGYARNSAMELANGKYITFVDSDDYVEPDLLERLMAGIKRNNADTCIGGWKRVNNDGTIIAVNEYVNTMYNQQDVYVELFKRMLGSAPDKKDYIKMAVWNSLYSMDIINDNHIAFPSEREFISEETIFNSEYYKYAQNVCLIDSTAYNYRVTPGSLTQKYRSNKLSLSCALYNEVEKRIEGMFPDGDALIRLQKKFLINIRDCISQERGKVSKKKFKDIVKAVGEITNTDTVKRVSACYPNSNLKLSARIYVLLVKYRCNVILSIFADLGLL